MSKQKTKVTREKESLTVDEIDALREVRDGADVTGFLLAERLREVKRKEPRLLCICDRQGEYSVHERLPYFGAITTKAGEKYLDNCN